MKGTIKQKYLGHIISGSKGFYWSYAMGQDIHGKTISDVKKKIRKLEYGYDRNPGTKWHVDRVDELQLMRSHAMDREHWNYLDQRAFENKLAADASQRLGIPNPVKKKFPLLGLGLIVGIGYLIWRANK